MLHELVASTSLSVWQIADSGFRQCSDRFSGRGWQKANTNLQVLFIPMHTEVGTSAVQYSRLSRKMIIDSLVYAACEESVGVWWGKNKSA